VADAPEISFSTTIVGASGSSPQLNQVCNNRERSKVCREVERAGRPSLTSRFSFFETLGKFAEIFSKGIKGFFYASPKKYCRKSSVNEREKTFRFRVSHKQNPTEADEA